MLTVGNLLILAGYTLVYAAVANGGVLYRDPWVGLFREAYPASAPSSAGGTAS
jgi:hypothetical protein